MYSLHVGTFDTNTYLTFHCFSFGLCLEDADFLYFTVGVHNIPTTEGN